MPLLSLSNQHIDIWLIEPSKINDTELLAQYQSLITSDELTRVKRYLREKDQHSALITRAFVRCVLAHYADIAPSDWQFGKGFNGKPFVENHGVGLEFNLSHAKDVIVCAVTKSYPLGIDVEHTKRKSDTYKLAPRYFAEQEIAALEQIEYQSQPQNFYDYWTLKESYIKACGDGLAIPLDHFAFDLSDREAIKLSFAPQRDDNPQQWQSWLFEVNDDHRMALTIKANREQAVTHTLRYLTPLSPFKQINLPLSL